MEGNTPNPINFTGIDDLHTSVDISRLKLAIRGLNGFLMFPYLADDRIPIRWIFCTQCGFRAGFTIRSPYILAFHAAPSSLFTDGVLKINLLAVLMT